MKKTETIPEYLERIIRDYKDFAEIDQVVALEWLIESLQYAATKKLPKELVSLHTLKVMGRL